MSYSTDQRIALIEATRGMRVEFYPSKLDLILALMNNGGIAREPDFYAGPGHKAALDEIEKQLAIVRQSISEEEARDKLRLNQVEFEEDEG